LQTYINFGQFEQNGAFMLSGLCKFTR